MEKKLDFHTFVSVDDKQVSKSTTGHQFKDTLTTAPFFKNCLSWPVCKDDAVDLKSLTEITEDQILLLHSKNNKKDNKIID